MPSRTLAQLVVVTLAILATALGAVVALRELGGAQQATTADAGSCDASAMPTALSPAREDSVLLLFSDDGVRVTLDGKPLTSVADDPQSFPIGEHTLRAACAEKAVELKVELVAFMPAALHASCGAITVFGAACESCPLLADARKAAAKAGKGSGVFLAAAAQEKLELQERPRSRTVLMNRWNALTERYSRVLQAVGRDAPGAVASASERFEQLSRGFRDAGNAGDLLKQDESIRTAEETLRVFVKTARLARPGDCDFQRRLTAAF